MKITAVILTLLAWFFGLVLDANIDMGQYTGFFELRILFPILVMGVCILEAIKKNNKQQ